MPRFENIWREQCEAAQMIKARYGRQAAFDYLVGEKLLHFVSAARSRPEFATQLPAFLAGIRQLFSGPEMLSLLAGLEAKLVADAHATDELDTEILHDTSGDLESLRQVADLCHRGVIQPA